MFSNIQNMFSNKLAIYIYIYIYRTYSIAVSKKILLLLIFSFGLFNLNVEKVFSQESINWANHTPLPCSDGLGTNATSVPWDGPYSKRICPDGPSGCCFTIVYYDKRYIASGQNQTLLCNKKYDYDVSVVGIFYEDEGCKTYNKDNLIAYFHKKVFSDNCQRKGFRDSITKCCDEPTFDNSYSYIQTRLKCYNSNGIECDPNQNRCCYKLRRADFKKVGDDCEFVGWYEEYAESLPEPPCPSTCTPKCNDVLMEHISVTACNVPCNWNEWGNIITINVPTQCPGCVLQVGYRTRITNGCLPVFTDYKIEFIIYDWNACNLFPCNFNAGNGSVFFNNVATYLLNHLLNPSSLSNGNCINNVRLMKANCFSFENVPNSNLKIASPCDITYCCWVNLKVCKISDEIQYTILNRSNWSNENCRSGELPSPCYYNCFEELFMPEQ